MVGIALSLLWILVGVLLLGGVLTLVFWAIRKAGFAIPPNIESIVWAIFAILVLIYILTALAGGGLPQPRLR